MSAVSDPARIHSSTFCAVDSLPRPAQIFYRRCEFLAEQSREYPPGCEPDCHILVMGCMDGREADTLEHLGLLYGPKVTFLPFAGTIIDQGDASGLEGQIRQYKESARLHGEELLVFVSGHYSSRDREGDSCAAHQNDIQATRKNARHVARWVQHAFSAEGPACEAGGRVLTFVLESDVATESRCLLDSTGNTLIDTHAIAVQVRESSWSEERIDLCISGLLWGYHQQGRLLPAGAFLPDHSLRNVIEQLTRMFTANVKAVGEALSDPRIPKKKDGHQETAMVVGNGWLIREPNQYFLITHLAPGLVGIDVALAYLLVRAMKKANKPEGYRLYTDIFINLQARSSDQPDLVETAQAVRELGALVKNRLRDVLRPGTLRRIDFDKKVMGILGENEPNGLPRDVWSRLRTAGDDLRLYYSVSDPDYHMKPFVP